MGETWERGLIRDRNGNYKACTSNVAAILTHRNEWRNVIALDAFAGVIVKRKAPSWDSDTCPEIDEPGDWTHEDTLRTSVWITREYNVAVPSFFVDEAVQIVAARYVTHPIRDWFQELKWDRKARIDDHLIRLAGAEDTAYTRAVTKNFFLGAVARIMRPGEKVDTMLILEGEQGIGKSTWFRTIASEGWFLETTFDIGSKDGYQALRRKWIVEMGELDALNRTELSKFKQFITAVKDSYRPPYGRNVVDFMRQCVFGGSFNPNGGGYLKDVTGARRFNPVIVKTIDLRAVRAEREQLWAEAVFRFRQGEKWHMRDPRMLKAAAEEAEARRQTDPWEHHIRLWLEDHKREKNGVTTEEILTKALEMPKDRQGRGEQMRAAMALRAIGWDVVRQDQKGARRYFPEI